MGPSLTVIIPTRNRSALLASALESLVKQTLSQEYFEVIVADNGSSDGTSELIATYGKRLKNLRTIYDPEPGLHTGRHAGMKAANSDILVFTDDDIEAFPTWLASIQEGFADPAVALLGGNSLPMFLEAPPRWLVEMWEQPRHGGLRAIPTLSLIEFPRTQNDISPHQVWGCNFAIRKRVLLAAGGFHPDGMPKELIRFRGDGETHVSRFVAKNCMRCIFSYGASVYHKVTKERMTVEYFHQRGFHQGISDSYSALRRQGPLAKGGKRNHLRSTLSWAAYRLRNHSLDRHVRCVLDEMRKGYWEGYSYHQLVYRDDPQVRDWVHKETYF